MKLQKSRIQVIFARISPFISTNVCKPYGKHMPERPALTAGFHVECPISDNYMIHPLDKRIKWFAKKSDEILLYLNKSSKKRSIFQTSQECNFHFARKHLSGRIEF